MWDGVKGAQFKVAFGLVVSIAAAEQGNRSRCWSGAPADGAVARGRRPEAERSIAMSSSSQSPVWVGGAEPRL